MPNNKFVVNMVHLLKQVSPKYEYGTLQTLDFLSVMDADGLESSHAISVDVAVSTPFKNLGYV